MTQEFEGRVAIVTGAAGGVGSAVVRLLRERGARVVAEDIDPGVTAAFADDDGILALVADVAAPETGAAAVAAAVDSFGRLDVLVNNAARYHTKSVGDTTAEDWDQIFATNLRGHFLHTRAALPALAATRGSIVNVGSISGLIGMPNQALYGATKGAVIQFTRMTAIEFAPQGVRVNAVAPGAIDTPFMDESLKDVEDPAAFIAFIESVHPLGRRATPVEIAEPVLFLASDRASAITGAVLTADMGYTAQ